MPGAHASYWAVVKGFVDDSSSWLTYFLLYCLVLLPSSFCVSRVTCGVVWAEVVSLTYTILRIKRSLVVLNAQLRVDLLSYLQQKIL